jgi:hypothetical protein
MEETVLFTARRMSSVFLRDLATHRKSRFKLYWGSQRVLEAVD